MEKYRLCDVEEIVCEKELLCDEEIAEKSECMLMIVEGWYVYIEELNLSLRTGVVYTYDENEEEFTPDFAVTVIYEGRDSDVRNWLYFEQDGFVISLANLLSGRMCAGSISELCCELVVSGCDDEGCEMSMAQ